jgi:hypothetical protein
MNRVKYILGNINLLNIILIGFLVFFVNYTILPFLNSSIHYSLPVMQKLKTSDSITDKTPEQTKPPSPLDYIIIADQNLFHPERKIPVETKETQAVQRPDFILYGTLVTENLKMAFLDDLKSPFASRGRGKRQRTLKAGESLSGYTLSEVYADKVFMVKGDDNIEVTINDPTKPKRIATKPGTAPIASSQAPGMNGKQPLGKTQTSSVPASSAEKRALKEQKKKEKQTRRPMGE